MAACAFWTKSSAVILVRLSAVHVRGGDAGADDVLDAVDNDGQAQRRNDAAGDPDGTVAVQLDARVGGFADAGSVPRLDDDDEVVPARRATVSPSRIVLCSRLD